ncbi:ABC transporter permease subunit [Sphingobacterium sp. DK4209]|uniref:ABC transporter permease subunit n=1 Tax=Sphingobacterium zhuxiongii TaxID=2662364 RepID=A0A5Q0QCG7_9SPHI|nr:MULTISPECIES: ABC transporter permease subunit [unclassified Sphingobacterium]MVZ64656.1 ABC transporter permease subunit [Sphingobacterium sp. DK4209]QGA26994.1 ABC transporter permease subunit [Sphingobacterium sp. dk4302]
MNKIIRYVFVDLLRNKTILFYTLLLLGLSVSVYSMEDNYEKGLVSLLNIVLFVVPLVSIVFTSIYLYNSAEFINLLVSQPLKRSHIWLSIFVGLAGALCLSFFVGVGIPTFIYAFTISGITLIGCGLLLCLIFVSIAMWTSVLIRDKSKGIGLAILLWLYFGLLFDALVLFMLFQFSDYPIENLMVALSMLNPIDISRILILLELDLSAMMGYTGAIFRDFFGTILGMGITLFIMLLWCIIPLWLSLRYFKKKDL